MRPATYPPVRIAIDIDDDLLRAVEVHAAEEGATLEAAFERALRAFLASPPESCAGPPPVPAFGGQGVQPGVDLADSAALLDIMDAESR